MQKKIYQYDINGNFIKCYENITKVARDLNIHKTTLCKASLGKINKGFTKGYYWSRVLLDKFKIN